MGLLPHPDLHPGEVVPPGEVDDVFEAVVSPGAPLLAYPQGPHGEAHVVHEHQHPVHGDLVKGGGLLDRLAAEVHKGPGL